MHNELFTEVRFQGYAHFLVQTLFGNPIEVPEQVDLLVLHGYVESKKDKWKLTNKGIEKAVGILQDSKEEEEV